MEQTLRLLTGTVLVSVALAAIAASYGVMTMIVRFYPYSLMVAVPLYLTFIFVVLGRGFAEAQKQRAFPD